MQLKMSRGFQKRIQKRFDQYDLQVGILQNDEHREARSSEDGLSSYAGGPVRKKGPSGSITLAEVSKKIREEQDVPYLTDPFKRDTAARREFSTTFFRFVQGKMQKRRVENALQAVVRNPILRGEYGENSRWTTTVKGFNRFLIDTGQFFKAIIAEVKAKRGGRV